MNLHWGNKKAEEVRAAERNKKPFPDFVLNDEGTLLLHRDTLSKMVSEESEARTHQERIEQQRKMQSGARARPHWGAPCPAQSPEDEDAAQMEKGWPRKKPGAFMHKLFDRRDVITQFRKLMTVEQSDARAKTKAYFDLVKAAGEYRALPAVRPDFREQLCVLHDECPNFAEPIAYVRRVMALAAAENKPPAFAKILLDGPPGVGKTYFAQRLAKVMGSTLHIVHLEAMQMANDLVGNSRNWSNASTGLLFNVLIDSPRADAVILLDEIDKVRPDERFDVNGALLGILEEGTAARFRDQCETWLELDASKLIYIATSNHADAIHPAVRTRLKKFDIGLPHDSTAVIKNIFRSVQAEFPVATRNMALTDGALERLLKLSPRKIREALRDAVGIAADARRLGIVAEDIEDTPAPYRVGF